MTNTFKSKELNNLLTAIGHQPNQDFLPLANTPTRFVDFVYFLRMKKNCRAHKEQLVKQFKITERQVQFYARAGEELFGLFDTSEPGFIRLTSIGKSLAYQKKEEVVLYIKMQMNKMDIVQQFITKDISEDLTPVVQAIESKEKWAEEYSLTSVERRASTIRSWVEFVREDSVSINESEILRFVKNYRSILSHLFHAKQAI